MRWHVGQRERIEEVNSAMTITLTSSMSVAQMQARIDQIPKFLSSNVTIQFADGSYSFGGTPLWIHGFRGNGTLYIQGNPGESGKHTNQAVIIDQGNSNGFMFQGCSCSIAFRNIRFQSSTTSEYWLVGSYFCRFLEVYWCCFDGASQHTYAIVGYNTTFDFHDNYVGSIYLMSYAGVCGHGVVHDNSEISSSDKPSYNYSVQRASTLGYYGTTPAYVVATLGSITPAGRLWT